MRRMTGCGTLAMGIALLIEPHGLALAIDVPDVAELRSTLANNAISPTERARRALEGSNALDLAAQRATSPKTRRKLWSDAAGLIDGFLGAHPQVESAPLLRFQAAVYRWAEGRSFAQQLEMTPADAQAKAGAIQAFDDVVARLRAIPPKPGDAADPLAQNVRFRLAQAIADRAALEPENAASRLMAEREALGLLDASLTSPGLRAYARLLRAQLASRLGLYGQAQMEIEEAEKITPPPLADALIEAKVAALAGRDMFGDARAIIEVSKVDDALKRLLSLRVILARRRGLPPGRERRAVDSEAFQVAGPLVGSSKIEARRGLMELARAVDEPASDSRPEWWDLLAEGHIRLGDTTRAGRLEAKGADRAELVGQDDLAASLRFKAGAFLFEAEKFAEADPLLTRVFESKKAPRELRAKAGMLRALARGRALATKKPGATRHAYAEALEVQVADYPEEAVSGEARWLLAQLRLASGRPEDALALLSGIRHGHSRWLEARLLAAELLREAVDSQRITHEQSATKSRMDEARRSIRTGIEAATEVDESVALLLRLVLLELTPGAGNPGDALDACDRLLKVAARAEQHREARLYRIVALAQGGQTVEAEQSARSEARADLPTDLMPALRPLDRLASEADSETPRRRLGLILRILTSRMTERLDQVPQELRDEVRIRHARALLFSGDPVASKREVAAWGGPQQLVDQELIRDLADLYLRLEIFGPAIDAERLLASRLAAGSPPWFEARYGLALAYYRSDRAKDARQVIDATAILHPELGGGELRGKYERLRQKLGNEGR